MWDGGVKQSVVVVIVVVVFLALVPVYSKSRY